MWTKQARILHTPRTQRYPSDITDAEWEIVEPHLQPPPLTHMRDVMDGVRYVLRADYQWRQLPKDFPPRSTVYSYFWEW